MGLVYRREVGWISLRTSATLDQREQDPNNNEHHAKNSVEQ